MQMLRVAGRRSGVPLTRGPPLPRSQERRATSDGGVTTRRRMLAVRHCALDAGQRDAGVVELGETCLAIIEFPTATAAFNAGRAGAPQFSVAPWVRHCRSSAIGISLADTSARARWARALSVEGRGAIANGSGATHRPLRNQQGPSRRVRRRLSGDSTWDGTRMFRSFSTKSGKTSGRCLRVGTSHDEHARIELIFSLRGDIVGAKDAMRLGERWHSAGSPALISSARHVAGEKTASRELNSRRPRAGHIPARSSSTDEVGVTGELAPHHGAGNRRFEGLREAAGAPRRG